MKRSAFVKLTDLREALPLEYNGVREIGVGGRDAELLSSLNALVKAFSFVRSDENAFFIAAHARFFAPVAELTLNASPSVRQATNERKN